MTSKVSWSSRAIPPGPSLPLAPPRANMKMPPGPQWMGWGRGEPALAGSSPAPVGRVGLGVQHGVARGADAGDDQIPALQRLAVVAVALVAEGAGAGVPAEVV